MPQVNDAFILVNRRRAATQMHANKNQIRLVSDPKLGGGSHASAAVLPRYSQNQTIQATHCGGQ